MFIEAAKCKNKNKKNVYFLFNEGLRLVFLVLVMMDGRRRLQKTQLAKYFNKGTVC